MAGWEPTIQLLVRGLVLGGAHDRKAICRSVHPDAIKCSYFHFSELGVHTGKVCGYICSMSPAVQEGRVGELFFQAHRVFRRD